MDKNIFVAKNPWLSGRLPVPPVLPRPVYDNILNLAQQPRMLLIFGPRRAGKTTLLKELARRLITYQQVDPKKVVYLDLDTMNCQDVLSSPGSLLKFCNIDPIRPPRDMTYILIDGIQRLDEPGLLLKAMYDLDLPIRLIVTGSSAFGLRAKVRQSLVGRSSSLFLWPLAPPEIPLDDTYLKWGGFPEVRLAPDDATRQEYLADMWAAYTDREIGGFLKTQKLERFRLFTELLAGQVGQLVNLNELANTLGVSRDTLARYLAYLQKSFLVRDLRPFTTNRRGELTKMPKVFFSDPGLLNLLSGHPGNAIRNFSGSVYENIVEIILRGIGGNLYFWRTERGAEVDFVHQREGHIIPVEVKAAAMSRPRISRGYRNFLKTYHPGMGVVVNESLDQEIKIEGTRVRFMPMKELPYELW